MAIETTKLIDQQITNQVTGRLDKIGSGLNSQILEGIDSTITEKVLPGIQDTLCRQEKEIPPWWTVGTVGYIRFPKSETPRKH